MKIANYHEGDRSEMLATTILSTIGHIVPVPRQADHFGVDMFVHLFTREGRGLSPTGPTIAVQIKSNLDDIKIEEPDGIQSLHSLAVPFFIGIVSRTKRQIALYSALFRFTAYWDNPHAAIVFDLKSDNPRLSLGRDSILVGCGPPIIIARQDEVDHSVHARKVDARDGLLRTLSYWTRLELDAISWRAVGLPMAPCPPVRYEPNVYPGAVPNISFSTEQVRLGPLLNALQHATFAFQQLSHAPIQEGQLNPKAMEMLHELAQSTNSHGPLISELCYELGAQFQADNIYTVD